MLGSSLRFLLLLGLTVDLAVGSWLGSCSLLGFYGLVVAHSGVIGCVLCGWV